MEKPHRIEVEEFPCKKLGYCPYGYLVEGFPVEEPRGEKGYAWLCAYLPGLFYCRGC